ncbi:MAG: 1-deoxy-D-xylulose-5-phosphate reductoisomerase [Ignavibacteria bacterium]|nr:1-deoxy-D-xylulose-5-phosphate reductoisomerase [Ignavibacteria bacterium]
MNTPKRNIAILGSTGSIGRSALDVLASMSDTYRVRYLTANRNIEQLQEQIRQFRPRAVVVLEECNASVLRRFLNGSTEVLFGEEGMLEIVQRDDVDVVLSSLVGFAGVKPTLAGIEAGKDIALANKETLVVAGELIMEAVRRKGVRLIPVDSEHSAILQCLQGERISEVTRLILTASGGPFLHLEKEHFPEITIEQALNHPTWKMGSKITIDSATLMNKGLEVIEAFWLFGLPPEKIEVVIHPQSIIHSMVEFADGSMKAQMGLPDMRMPIRYALTYPERTAAEYGRIDFSRLKQMTFLEPDREKFRCLQLAYDALATGGTAPAVLNAANEVAVQMFLDRQISFAAIPAVIEEALEAHAATHALTLDDLVRIDGETREQVRQHVTGIH